MVSGEHGRLGLELDERMPILTQKIAIPVGEVFCEVWLDFNSRFTLTDRPLLFVFVLNTDVVERVVL